MLNQNEVTYYIFNIESADIGVLIKSLQYDNMTAQRVLGFSGRGYQDVVIDVFKGRLLDDLGVLLRGSCSDSHVHTTVVMWGDDG